MTTPISKIIRRYESGIYTRSEILIELIQAAANTPPEVIVKELPAFWLDELRSETLTPPARPEEIVFVESVCNGPGYDGKERQEKMVQLLFTGEWRWHRFFAGG